MIKLYKKYLKEVLSFMNNRIMQKEIVTDSLGSLNSQIKLNQPVKEFLVLQQVYEAGIKEIRTKLEILDDEFKIKHDHNPIHHMEYRLKSLDSIVNKLKKRNLEVSLESMVENLTDIAGVRVIVIMLVMFIGLQNY